MMRGTATTNMKYINEKQEHAASININFKAKYVAIVADREIFSS